MAIDIPCVNTDHSLITAVLPPDHSVVHYAAVRRRWGKFNTEAFRNELSVSDLVTRPCSHSVSESLNRYDEVLKKLLDKHAPLKSISSRVFARSSWYTDSCRATNTNTRRLLEDPDRWKAQFELQRRTF